MRRRTNPLIVVAMVAVAIVAFVAAFVVKGILPDTMQAWKNLIFWSLVAGVDIIGGLLVGKLFGRK